MNRGQRGRLEALVRRFGEPGIVGNKAALLGITELADNDASVPGFTSFLATGEVKFIDAALLRRGGRG